MRKSILYSFLLITIVFFTNCKSETKTSPVTQVKKSTVKFSLQNAQNSIGWTAYKTTEKIPVNGQFKKVTITANGEGNTIKSAVNNTEFSIPVSSIFTKNSSRDFKIRKHFFSLMNTELLSGKLEISSDSTGVATLKMNNITDSVAFNYTITNNVFSLTATLDINKWNAKEAIVSLNKACNELHKGADGVSKTWDEVRLNITSTF